MHDIQAFPMWFIQHIEYKYNISKYKIEVARLYLGVLHVQDPKFLMYYMMLIIQ
jgi:hypothetical protein